MKMHEKTSEKPINVSAGMSVYTMDLKDNVSG